MVDQGRFDRIFPEMVWQLNIYFSTKRVFMDNQDTGLTRSAARDMQKKSDHPVGL
ncbi:MAG: hypothetical protein GY737_27895 [Desulfobacteraceae bacterium]|nr:hypothetical protein [Desulfobacteraceae bacterium]